MTGPQIEYNREHARLESIVKSVNRPGDYFVAGRIEGSMPRMSVKPIGTIAFPILKTQVRSLIHAAVRAPYGRGPETVLDTSVRDCWQIAAGRVHLAGASWEETFRSILESVADGLGCHRDRLSARLYKLLIYEPGGFFSEHRDTEKVAGMIATLVVSLPTAGEGGELVIRHLDREATVNLHVDDPGEVAYAAFYADCIHLTRPVEQGHRVSLVYNVVMKPRFRSALPGPPDFSRETDEISEILAEWAATWKGPRKLVWLLEHEYSQAGLSHATLKGLDEAVEQTLAQAAERSGCVLHSATLSINEAGTPDVDDIDEYGREIDYTGRLCSIEEIYDCSYTLESWARHDLTGSELPGIPLLDEEVLPFGSLDDAEPDEQTLFEASGNEGVSLERSYRLAALVIWPRSKEASVIADSSIDAAIHYVERMLARGAAHCGAPVTGRDLISQLIDSWPRDRRHLYSTSFRDQNDRSLPSMLRLLSSLSDDEQSVRFLREVVTEQYGARMNDALVPFLRKSQPSTLAQFLPAFTRTNIPRSPGDVLALIARLRKSQPGTGGTDRKRILKGAMRAAFQSLPEAFDPPLPEGEPEWRRPKPKVLDAATVRNLFVASHGFALDAEAESAAVLFSRYPKEVDPFRTIPEALHELCRTLPEFGKSTAFESMWHHSSSRLLERSAIPPQAPKDERIEAPISCNCNLCGELKAFCLDREAKTKGFKAVQYARAHIEHSIRRANLDMDCHTVTYGRPYTLVCTKVPRSYRRRLERYAEDIDHIQLLSRASPSNDSPEIALTLARLLEALEQKRT